MGNFIQAAVGSLLLMGMICSATWAQDQPTIIFDSDFRTDCDDAGALALLHNLADDGECTVLGVIASTTGPHVVAAIDAVNTHFGRGDLPIGLSPQESLPEGKNDLFAPALAEKFENDQSNADAPDSTRLYRQLLNDAADNSVTIVVVGGQSPVALLLESPADYEEDGSINLTGQELIAAKVKELVIMGGNFEDTKYKEFNITLDVRAADRVAKDWPTPIVYSGFEIGHGMFTGGTLKNVEANPVALAYYLYPSTIGGRNRIGGRHSWDPTAVYYAVRGTQDLWTLSELVNVGFANGGETKVEPAPDNSNMPPRRHLIMAGPKHRVEQAMESLIARP